MLLPEDLDEIIDQLEFDQKDQLVEAIEETGPGGYVKFYLPEEEEMVDKRLKSREEMNYSNPVDSFVVQIDNFVCPKCFCYLLLVPRNKISDKLHSKCIACGWCHVY